MTTLLTAQATEGSTFVVTVPFVDEDGTPVIPASIKWSLTDDEGDAVNSRTDVAIVTPAATIDIVLKGLDLPSPGDQMRSVYLTVEATYNSSLGTGLPLNVQCRIEVLPLEAFV